jgi:hypothetical protein
MDMNSIFPQGGLAQAYTALSRFIGVEQNTRKQDFAAQIKKAGNSNFNVEEELSAQARTLTADREGFKEFFVSSSSSFDPSAPRGSYVNIVV